MYGYQLNEAEVFFPITNWATSWVQLATDSVLWRQPAPLHNFTSVVIECIKRNPGDATYKGFFLEAWLEVFLRR